MDDVFDGPNIARASEAGPAIVTTPGPSWPAPAIHATCETASMVLTMTMAGSLIKQKKSPPSCQEDR